MEKMVILFAELILPILILFIAIVAIRAYNKIRYPYPLVIGCIIKKVCVILYQPIATYLNADQLKGLKGKVLRTARRKQFRIIMGYLCEQAVNTSLFLSALRFEQDRIDEGKSGLQYEPREVLVLELIKEVEELRFNQVKWQLRLILRRKLGLSLNKAKFKAKLLALLREYKRLEGEIVILVGMEEDLPYRDMLANSLGLHWGVNGAGPKPM